MIEISLYNITDKSRTAESMIALEEAAKSEGYTITYSDGDGFQTWLVFEDIDYSLAVEFKLKYM